MDAQREAGMVQSGKVLLWLAHEYKKHGAHQTFGQCLGEGVSEDEVEQINKHVIDRVVGYGVAWHEGQLFGWMNQLIGVVTALMLVTLSITGFVMWRRRKPDGQLGAPIAAATPAKLRGVTALVLMLAVFLPMLAASLLAMWLIELLILRRFASVAKWLGLDIGGPRSKEV